MTSTRPGRRQRACERPRYHFDTGAGGVERILFRCGAGTGRGGPLLLAIDFDMPVQTFQSFINGAVLNNAHTQQLNVMAVTQSQLVHFKLSVNGPTSAAVQWTVYDLRGNVIMSAIAAGGDTITRNVFLNRGVYFVQFTRIGATPLTFSFGGLPISDPVGLGGIDATLDPPSLVDQVTFIWITWDWGYFGYLGLFD